ncbi:MAG TPA: hypothetical protein HA224_04325 [Nanoarchaeota archaeon]|nr:hypothetical protein [Nanoarchaeota archaeon]
MATTTLFRANKRAASSVYEGNYGGMILLIIMSGAILTYLLLVTPAEREKFGIVPEKYARTLLDVAPGTISVSESQARAKDFNFGTINLDYSINQISEELRNTIALRSAGFSEDTISLPVTLDQTAESILLQAVVSDKLGDGKLLVFLNGIEVFNEAVNKNQILKITLPKNLWQASNTLKFSVSSPGAAFWNTNSYSLVNVNLITNKYAQAKAITTQSFTLTGELATGLQKATLTAYVTATVPKSNYEITVNGKAVYSGIGIGSISLEIPNNYLVSGENKIAFSVAKDSGYRLAFTKITATYYLAGLKAKKYTFFVNDYNWNQIRDSGIYCTVKAVKSSGGDSVNVRVNGKSLKLGFIEGSADAQACQYFIKGDNELVLGSNEPVELSSLKVMVGAKQ